MPHEIREALSGAPRPRSLPAPPIITAYTLHVFGFRAFEMDLAQTPADFEVEESPGNSRMHNTHHAPRSGSRMLGKYAPLPCGDIDKKPAR